MIVTEIREHIFTIK